MNNLQTSWNLTHLFTDDFDPKIETEKVKLQQEADKFTAKWEKRTDWLENAQTLAQILSDYQNWLTNWGFYGKVGYYFFLRTSQDSIDPILKAKSNQIDEISTKIANQMQFVELRISKIEKAKQQEFLQSKELLEFRHFLERIFQASQYLLSESEEKIVNLLSFHKEKWSDMVSEFLNSEKIDFDLEKVENSGLESEKMIENKDENSERSIDLSTKYLQKPRKKYVRAVIFEPISQKFLFSYFGNVKKSNKYGLIGGGVDNGETEIEALKREIMEETGLKNYEIIGKVGGSILSPRDEEFEKNDVIKETVAYLVIAKNSNFISPKLSEQEIKNGFELQWKNWQEVKIEKPYSEEQILLERGVAKLVELGKIDTKLDLEELKKRYSFIQQKAKKDGVAKLCVNPVILQNGKVLITKRCADNPRRPNLWCLAGGKADENENVIETLIRETKEELGLEITQIEKYLPIEWDSLVPLSWDISSQNRKWRVIYFLVKTRGEIKLSSEELSEYAFINKEEIADYFTAEELDPKSELYRGGEFQVWDEIKKINLNRNNLENEILILGQKPEKVDNFRENVRVLLYDPKTDKYAIQFIEKWGEYNLLGGGVEKDHSQIETVKKELIEESGYIDFTIVSQLGGKIECFYEEDGKNFERVSTGFLAILNSESNVGTKMEDYEIEEGSQCVWKSKREVQDIFEKQVEKYFSYSYHLEFLNRGLEKMEELGLDNLSENVIRKWVESEKSQLLVATHNPSKVKRYQKQLADLPVKLVSLADLNLKIETPIEIGNTTLEIVKNKAKFYFDQTQMPCFSNDSGLFFEGVEDFEQPKTNVKGIAGILDENNQEEIYKKMIEFYQNLATKYGGELKGYFLDSYALFDGKNYFVKEVKRPILLTKTVNQKDIHFPICSLYKVKGKFYHDLDELEMTEFLAESVNGFKEIIGNWQKTQNLNSKNLENHNLQIENDNLENENLEETCKIEITFEELMTKLSDPNQEIRDQAVVKFDQIMEKYKPIATHELNAILRHKQVIDELRGFKNPDSARLASDDVDPQIVKTLLESVRSRFEISHNYYKLKAKLMGKEQLQYHERNVEYGKIIQSYSFEEAVVILRRVFAKLDNSGKTMTKNIENLEQKIDQKPEEFIKKNIVFDWFGVIFTDGEKKLVQEISKNLKTGKSEKDVWNLVRKEDSGELNSEQFTAEINKICTKIWTLQELYDLWENSIEAIKNVQEFIEKKQQNYNFYYLTNINQENFEVRKDHSILKSFQGGIASCDVNVRKPNPEIYQILLQKYNLKAEESVFIDDKLENIQAARNLNFETILFDENVDLEEKINEKLELSLENETKNSQEISQSKTLLIDAIDCIICKNISNSQNELSLNQELFDFLKTQNQRKIVVTNAKDETLAKIKELLNDKNFEIWTLEFEPDKTKSEYFTILLKTLKLKSEECFYFEHDLKALESAKKFGINGILYQNNQQIIEDLENILNENLELENSQNQTNKTNSQNQEILEIQAQSSQKIPENSFLAILDDYLQNGKIDVYPRTGKRGGAFMTGNTGKIIDPTFIFLNWTNTLNDVQTFAHEMGHACNYEMMKKTNKALTWDGSYLTMESPSTFMEDFILEDILQNCTNKEEKLSILMKKLNDDTSSIFRQISLYLFELELHSEFRAKGYLSGTEIGELFSKHMANYMGNAVEKSEGSKNWWIYWSHIRYMFYVYSYAAGLLISKSMQKRLKDNPQFITNIKEFYASGMDKTPTETLAEKLQIDATKSDIWLEGLEQTSKNLEMAENLATELGLI